MITSVNAYFIDGCGRCKLFATPQCKVKTWENELALLRKIVVSCNLIEELKWKQPCYTFNGKNVLLISAFKEHCVISFFKGSLLNDEHKLLSKPGENSQSTLWFSFTNVEEIMKHENIIKQYIAEAIELEKQGKKVTLKTIDKYELPEELIEILANNKPLKKAFEGLTPGRQKSYIIYISSAKNSATKISRIEKYIPKILEGKGFFD